MNSGLLPDSYRRRDAADTRVPLAVLGDSDSHSYRDEIAFPPDSPLRGGVHRATVAQWTDVLDALRGSQLDLGDFGVWGGRSRVVRLLEAVGCSRRAPRKQDYQFNLAFSGAGTSDLNDGVLRQVPRLLALMDEEPERWRRGVVVIRIGIVDLGGAAQLQAMAEEPQGAKICAAIDECVARIGSAMGAIRARHTQTRLLLVGLFDNADVPTQLDRWRSAAETANRRAALDRFDEGLRRLAAADPHTAFFDDRAWFAARWGGRAADGAPAYRDLEVAGLRVVHGVGDDLEHTALADGHAGLVVNTLWAQSVTQVLSRALGVPITPIDDAEVERFVRQRYAARR